MSKKGAIIITGANGGVGAAATEALVRKGESVIMACRNLEKASAVRRQILSRIPEAELQMEELRLDSFASVRDFAARMQKREIKALFNNAGVISRRYRLCEDGFEESLSVNFLAPVLLTRLLEPILGAGGRVVNMVSLTCALVNMDTELFERGEREFSQLGSYALSKLALLLYSIELSRRSSLSINLADPGIVDSGMISMGRWFDPLADIFFRPLCKSPERGAEPAVNALLSGSEGRIFKGKGSAEIAQRYLRMAQTSQSLWEKTEKVLHFL